MKKNKFNTGFSIIFLLSCQAHAIDLSGSYVQNGDCVCAGNICEANPPALQMIRNSAISREYSPIRNSSYGYAKDAAGVELYRFDQIQNGIDVSIDYHTGNQLVYSIARKDQSSSEYTVSVSNMTTQQSETYDLQLAIPEQDLKDQPVLPQEFPDRIENATKSVQTVTKNNSIQSSLTVNIPAGSIPSAGIMPSPYSLKSVNSLEIISSEAGLKISDLSVREYSKEDGKDKKIFKNKTTCQLQRLQK